MELLTQSGYLPASLSDTIDLIAAIGVAISLAGLLFAILQITRTKRSVEAAQTAADETHRQLTDRIQLYDLSTAIRHVGEVRQLLRSDENRAAAFRLTDLREVLVQIGANRGSQMRKIEGLQDSLAQISTLERALIRQEFEPNKAVNPVQAHGKLQDIADFLTGLATEVRLQTGGVDADS